MGLVVTIGLYYLIDSFFASGILLPMGYGQGPGQAYNWGHTYEVSYGFTNGTSFGLPWRPWALSPPVWGA